MKAISNIDDISTGVVSPIEKLNGSYRGKAYSTTITNATQFQEWRVYTGIDDGSYSNIGLGDEVTINDGTVTCTWIVAGFNTELNKGSSNILTTNHIALIPKTKYTDDKMNTDNVTTGGFKSAAIQSILSTIATRLNTIMSTHLKSRDILISNSVNTSAASIAGAGLTGASSGWEWFNTKCTLMSEVQVYGATVCSSSFYDTGEGYEKLPIFNFITPIHFGRVGWWLRGVASSAGFCCVAGGGDASFYNAGGSLGVRPLIIID